MVPRRTLLAAALLCAAVASARGQVIKATAFNCSDIATAFARLSSAYAGAQTSAPVTLQLTFACSVEFMCTDPSEMGSFSASNASTRNGKQPPVKVIITSGPTCRTGEMKPAISAYGVAALNDSSVFNFNSSSYPQTRVDLSISFIRVIGFADGYLASMEAWPNTRSTFTLKDVDFDQAGFYASNVDTASVTGGLFSGATYHQVELNAVATSVTIKDAIFQSNGLVGEPYPGAIGIYNLGAKAKVSITNNVIEDNGGGEYAKAVYVGFNGDVSASLTRNTFLNNTAGAAPYVLCVHNTGTAKRPATLSIAGSKGLDPSKPSSNRTAPWPTSANCSVAAFMQT